MSSTTGKNKAPLDAYYTPIALARACVGTLPLARGEKVWEPHAGGGAFCWALSEAGMSVCASDIDADAIALRTPHGGAHFYGVADALGGFPFPGVRPAWVVGNPPFTDVEKHIDAALSVAVIGVGFLLRLAVLEGQKRKEAWKHWPLKSVHVLVERPSFTGGGTDSAAYGFFYFEHGHTAKPVIDWLSWRGGQ